MAHIESARKRLRQSTARNVRNRSILGDLKTQVKKVLKAVKDKNADVAKTELKMVYSKLDKCAARRYLHPNTAHRYKARLTARVNSIPAAK